MTGTGSGRARGRSQAAYRCGCVRRELTDVALRTSRPASADRAFVVEGVEADGVKVERHPSHHCEERDRSTPGG